MRIKAKCKICGAEYIKTNGKSKYCSDKCRKEAMRRRYEEHKEERLAYGKEWREKQKEKNPHYARDRFRKIRGTKEYHRVCVICGKSFITPFSYCITCSKECSKEHRRRRDSKRRASPEKQHEQYISRKYGSEIAYQKYMEEVEQRKEQERLERIEQKRLEK